MSTDSFQRMILRTCNNGPMNPTDMQYEIDRIDEIVSQQDHACEDAIPTYSR